MDSKPHRLAAIVDHPVISGVFVACIVIGALLGAFYLTSDWSLARRVAGGAVSGAGVALIVTATRIVG
jgi:Kef-type K+ transport system membrane component KefB